MYPFDEFLLHIGTENNQVSVSVSRPKSSLSSDDGCLNSSKSRKDSELREFLLPETVHQYRSAFHAGMFSSLTHNCLSWGWLNRSITLSGYDAQISIKFKISPMKYIFSNIWYNLCKFHLDLFNFVPSIEINELKL